MRLFLKNALTPPGLKPTSHALAGKPTAALVAAQPKANAAPTTMNRGCLAVTVVFLFLVGCHMLGEF